MVHRLIAQFEEGMYIFNYRDDVQELLTETGRERWTAQIPESEQPVQCDDPLCRWEVIRIMRGLGYKGSMLEHGWD